MSNRSKLVAKLLIFVLFALSAIVTVSYGWFFKAQNEIDAGINGGMVEEYFHCGSGQEDDPFVITRPIHYSHMVEFFQRTTNLPVVYRGSGENVVEVKFGTDYLYFQIGVSEAKLADPSAADNDPQKYVFEYNDNGEIVRDEEGHAQKSLVLNMGGYTRMMPVGTSEVPFKGQITGGTGEDNTTNITIKNLNIVGTEDVLIDKEDGTRETVTRTTEDIGVFGYVTDDSRIENMYLSDVSIDLTETKADAEKVHVGYIVGHIVSYVNAGSLNYANQSVGTNATPISNVYVNHSYIRGGASAAAECNYGYIGYIELVDGVIASSISSSIGEIFDDGSGSEGWGGSINMTALFNRLKTVFNNAGTVYPTSEDVTKPDSVKGIPSVTVTGTANVGRFNNSTDIKVLSTPLGGNYIGFTKTIQSGEVNYVYSLKQNQTTTVTTYTKDGAEVPAKLLMNNGKYLAYRTNQSLEVLTYYTSNVNEAAKLIVDGQRWYTIISNTIYYLVQNNHTTVSFENVAPASATNWQINEDNELYTVINGTNYYLYFKAADASWALTKYRDAYYVSDGNNHYLYADSTGIIPAGITVENSSYIWHLSSEVGNTSFIYESNGTEYYLNFDGTELTRQTNSVTWTKDANGYYVTVAGEKYYLIYDGGWTARPLVTYALKDGYGNYLNSNNNHQIISTTNEEESVDWFLSNLSGNTTISTIINGTRYYLNYNNGLVLNTTSATWTKDGESYYITNGGKNYYLNYNSTTGNWEAVRRDYIVINDGNDNYIGNNGTTINRVGNESNATHWYFTGTNSGNLFTNIDGTVYYLNISNSKLTMTTTASTSWTYQNNSLKATVNNYDYYIIYDNGWNVIKLKYYTIKDGSNYLSYNGTNIVNQTIEANATHWYFSNEGTNPSGQISTIYNGNTVILGFRNGNFLINANQTTSWVNTDGRLNYTSGDSVYYIEFNGSNWVLSNGKYYVRSGSNYLSATNSGVTNETTRDEATVWTFSSGTVTNPSGNMSFVYNGTRYYLNGNNSGSMFRPSYSFQIGNSGSTSWTNDDNALGISSYFRTYYIRYRNGWSINNNLTTLTFDLAINALTFTEGTQEVPVVYCDEKTLTVSSIGINSYNHAPNVDFDKTIYSYTSTFEDTTETLYSGVQGTYRRGSYFPLRLALRNENEEESNSNYYSDYRVSKVNTGYIVSGTYSAASSSGQGDIRVSKYAMNNVSGSYRANSGFTNIYTFNGSNNAVTVDSSKFSDPESVSGKAYARFSEILALDNNYVYGLHFMDSVISNEKLIQAEAVTIFGNSYVNYDLPESCVDFNVLDKGQVIFFAGDYYTSTNYENSCFFSLHQVFRDENQHITAIKEIKQIYSTAENAQEDKYVYRFSDGTFSDGENTYDSLPSGYTSVFNTDWITNPRNGSSFSDSRIYYFEIPCNVGEYALGSVEGKDGGYLLYLDVASNGTQTYTYNKENGVMDAPLFTQTGYRANGKTINATLNTSFEIPEGNTNENFGIFVSFDEEELVYHVVILNETGNPMEVSIVLVDNDDNNDNSYLYSYVLYYNDEEVIDMDNGYDSDKHAYVSSASFTLGSGT